MIVTRLKLQTRKFPHPASYTNFNSKGLDVYETTRLFASFDALPWTVRLWDWRGEIILEIQAIAGKDRSQYQLVHINKQQNRTEQLSSQPTMVNGTSKKTTLLMELMLDENKVNVRDVSLIYIRHFYRCN